MAMSDEDMARYERAALRHLESVGVTDPREAIHVDGKERWAAWAAETIVWTIGEIRAGRYRESVRGLCQLYEYTGRNGGFLPVYLSDAKQAISNHLQDVVSQREACHE